MKGRRLAMDRSKDMFARSESARESPLGIRTLKDTTSAGSCDCNAADLKRLKV